MASIRCEQGERVQLYTPPRLQPAIALVDCNNFYAACERVFRPDWEGKPVVVLSNNDGCIIARSNEVKAHGIKMGEPYHKVRGYLRRIGCMVCSSNYALYGDMSRRVVETLSQFTPDLEVYSIDESFLNLTGVSKTAGEDKAEQARRLTQYGRAIGDTVKQWTGLPVSIGIAESKTLAKIANKRAKRGDGVANLRGAPEIEAILEETPVGELWGIGHRLALRLEAHGIRSARQLRDADERWIQHDLRMGIVGVRMVYELRGIPCLPFELRAAAKQGIACTRTFGTPVTELAMLRQAISAFTTRAAVKLRAQNSVAKTLLVFLNTDIFRQNEPQYANSLEIELPVATAGTPELIQYAKRALEAIYRPGYRYKKAGVVLNRVLPEHAVQGDFFDTRDREREHRLMQTVDRINAKMGQWTLRPAATGYNPAWKTRRQYCSPHYTTCWRHLPLVKGK